MEPISSIDLLTKKLKNAPQSVLDRVIGYVDTLVESTSTTKSYSLSTSNDKF